MAMKRIICAGLLIAIVATAHAQKCGLRPAHNKYTQEKQLWTEDIDMARCILEGEPPKVFVSETDN